MLPGYLPALRCSRSRVDFAPDPSRHPALSAPTHQCQLPSSPSPSPTLHVTPFTPCPHLAPSHPNRAHVFCRGVLFRCVRACFCVCLCLDDCLVCFCLVSFLISVERSVRVRSPPFKGTVVPRLASENASWRRGTRGAGGDDSDGGGSVGGGGEGGGDGGGGDTGRP